MSSVRLDNYIYTVENIENVRRHLRDGGTLSLTFTVHEQWIADRLFALLSGVFGHEPAVYQGNQWAWGTTFLVSREGPITPAGAADHARAIRRRSALRGGGQHLGVLGTAGFLDNSIFNAEVEAPTDDWPYPYMRSRQLPGKYGAVLLLTFVVAALLIRWGARPTGLGKLENWNFPFLGAAFALLETKGITEIALLFGSTWVTNSVVIASILVMILLANLLVLRVRNIPPGARLRAARGGAALQLHVLIPGPAGGWGTRRDCCWRGSRCRCRCSSRG